MRVDALKLSDFRGELLQYSNLPEAERILDTNYEKIALMSSNVAAPINLARVMHIL